MGQQPSSSGRHRDGRPRERRSSRDKRREKQQAQAQATALQSVAVGPSVAVPGAFGSVALPGARNVAVGPSIAVPGSIGIPGGQQLNFAVMPGVALGSSVAQIVQAPDFQASGMGFGSSAMGYGSSQASAPSADLLVPGVDFSPEALAATLPPLLPGLAARSNLPGLNTTVAAFPAGYTAPPTAAQLGMPGVSFAMPGSFAAAPLTTTQNLQAVLQPSQTMPALQMQFAADPLMLTMVPTANYVTPTANMVGQQPFATATPAPPVAGTPIPGTGLGSLKGVPHTGHAGRTAKPNATDSRDASRTNDASGLCPAGGGNSISTPQLRAPSAHIWSPQLSERFVARRSVARWSRLTFSSELRWKFVLGSGLEAGTFKCFPWPGHSSSRAPHQSRRVDGCR